MEDRSKQTTSSPLLLLPQQPFRLTSSLIVPICIVWGLLSFLRPQHAHFPVPGGRLLSTWQVSAAHSFCFAVQSQQDSVAPRTVSCPQVTWRRSCWRLKVNRQTALGIIMAASYASVPDLVIDAVTVCLCCPSKQSKDVQCFLKLDKPKISLN